MLKFHQIRKSVIYRSLRFLNSGLHSLEVVTNRENDTQLYYPPIFIIGAPRSGSTLLYQVLTDYYDIGYLSNLHCKFFGAPSYIERFLNPLKWRTPSNYTSYHGKTKGWTAPSECGEFWYRFFRRKPPYVPLEEVDNEKMLQLRKVINALVNAFDKPILFKNLYCSLRLQLIAKAIPEALFIIISRNLLDNAHSLLEGRQKRYGNYNYWWSAEPPEIEYLKQLPAHQQVVEQVRHLNALIENDKKLIGNDRFFYVKYENFCQNCHQVLHQLNKFLEFHGCHIKNRQEINYIPTHFSQSKTVKIEPEMYSKLVNYVQTISADNDEGS